MDLGLKGRKAIVTGGTRGIEFHDFPFGRFFGHMRLLFRLRTDSDLVSGKYHPEKP